MDNAPLLNAMDRLALESLFWHMIRTGMVKKDASLSFLMPPSLSTDPEENMVDIDILTDKMIQIIGKDGALAAELEELHEALRQPEVQAMIRRYMTFTEKLQKNPDMLRVVEEMVGGV